MKIKEQIKSERSAEVIVKSLTEGTMFKNSFKVFPYEFNKFATHWKSQNKGHRIIHDKKDMVHYGNIKGNKDAEFKYDEDELVFYTDMKKAEFFKLIR